MTVQSGDSSGSPDSGASQRRECIIDAALSLFAEHGVEGTTMKMLAKRAGISPGLTYHYFKGKADLLDQVIEDRGVTFPKLSGRHRESVDVVLPEYVREVGRHLTLRLDVIWLFFREYRSSKTVAQRIGKRRDACVAELAAYLEARQLAGEVRELTPEVASRTLLGALFQTYLEEVPEEEYLTELVDIFLAGIKA